MSITDFSRISRRFPALQSLSTSRLLAWALTAAIHLFALVRLFQTEVGPFGQSVYLLVWISLNCLWLLILRRPAISAALSLAMVELLIAVSLFKFKITWMTVTFLDVLVIDPDSVSFLISVMPGLRGVIALSALAGVVLLVVLWLFDCVRVRRSVAAMVGAVSLGAAAILSNFVPELPHEPFQGVNHVSGFARSMVVSLTELTHGGFLDIDRAVAAKLKPLPADDDCAPATRRPHIIMVLDESSYDIRSAPGVRVPEDYGRHFESFDGKTRRLTTEGAGGPTWYTEYNVLTGLSALSYGRMSFHVTRLAAGRVERGLPQALRRCGYKTFTLYPAYGSFLSARRFQKTAGIDRMLDAKEMGAGDVEPDAFYFEKAKALIGRERGNDPLFLFVYTVANHFPWDNSFRPDLTPDWTKLNASAETDEYVRRQTMSARDYETFVANLKKAYPDDAFLIVRFGDHPPAIGARLVEPGLSDTKIAERVMSHDPRYYTTYYSIDTINFKPIDLSSAQDQLDAAYLPIVIQEAAGLPLDSTFIEQKAILQRCNGEFYRCRDGAEARRFNRLLVEAGLIKGF
ncbi:MAG: sulfatase-like hydrolase/transferase [Pseudorhodoplanes sp.]